jgi:heat shock protein HtpX
MAAMASPVPDRRLERRGLATGALIGGFVAVFVVIGLILAAITRQWLVLVVFVVIGAVLAGLAWSASAGLGLRLTGAQPADERDHARLDNLTEGLSLAVGVPKPELFVVDDPGANAFACGRDERSAKLVVTTGLLDAVSRVELEGVVARELGRIKSGEIARQTLLVGVVGVPAAWSDYGLRYWWGPAGAAPPRSAGRSVLATLSLVGVPLAPLTAMVIRASAHPDDEGFADLDAVDLTRYPPGLGGALVAMAKAGTTVRTAGRATAHLWIADPMPVADPPAVGDADGDGDREGFAARRLAAMDTHTPLQHRIDTLAEL